MRYSINTIKISLEVKDTNLNKACSAESAHDIIKAFYLDLKPDQEHFSILALNNKLNPIGFKTLFSGGQISAKIDLRIIFRNAILLGAINVILAHNHPSLDITPSKEDITSTLKIIAAGNTLDIQVLDHIILGGDKYCSMRNNKLMEGV